MREEVFTRGGLALASIDNRHLTGGRDEGV